MLGIPQEETGFFGVADQKVGPVLTVKPGIYVAGTATAPRIYLTRSPWAGRRRCGRTWTRSGRDEHAREEPYTIAWEEETGSIIYIDQTLLPGQYRVVRCTTVETLRTRDPGLEVRGRLRSASRRDGCGARGRPEPEPIWTGSGGGRSGRRFSGAPARPR